MAEPATDKYRRETADATATAERTFTEGEAYALVADNVQRETASLTATIDQLKSEKASLEDEKADLQSKLDIEQAAREKAQQDLQEFKDSIANEKAMEARKGERVAKIREVAKHLKEEFYTPERAQRWAAMDDEAFDAYAKELAELSAGATTTTTSEPPRETAMAGSQVSAPAEKGQGLKGLAGFYGLPKGGN